MSEYPCTACGLDFYSEKHYMEHFCCPSAMEEPTPAPAEPKLPGHVVYHDLTATKYGAYEILGDPCAIIIGAGRVNPETLEAIAKHMRHLRTIKPATGGEADK